MKKKYDGEVAALKIAKRLKNGTFKLTRKCRNDLRKSGWVKL